MRRPGQFMKVCAGVFLVAAIATNAHAVSTWVGGGGDDNWTTSANWVGGVPSSGSTTELVFGGTTRLTPFQDIAHPFRFNVLTFADNAGAFNLGGTVSIGDPQLGLRKLEFDGTDPVINMNSDCDIIIQGCVQTQSGTNTVNVTGAGSLQVPWFPGADNWKVIKNGSGKLIIYEHADGQYYAQASSNVAAELWINDGDVEIGTRSDRYRQNGSVWVADSSQNKTFYSTVVGDGIGAAGSATLTVVDASADVIGDDGIVVNSDGILDVNGQQSIDGPITINGGLVKMGNATNYNRVGETMIMNGGGRFESTKTDGIWWYDGGGLDVDNTGTRAVIVAQSRIVGSTNGPTFNIADKPGDDIDLEITMTLGGANPGPGAIQKNGAGTMLINGHRFSTADQEINEGTLLVTGTAQGTTTGRYVVKSGATLGGTGTITRTSAGTVVVVDNGGTLAGGLSVGTLTVGQDLDFQSGAMLEWELGDNVDHYDIIQVDGTLTLGATATIKLFKLGSVDPVATDVFTLFTDNAAVNATWTFDYGTTGWSGGQILIDDDNEQVILTGLSAGEIPEPGTMLLLGTGILGAIGFIRRRRMK